MAALVPSFLCLLGVGCCMSQTECDWATPLRECQQAVDRLLVERGNGELAVQLGGLGEPARGGALDARVPHAGGRGTGVGLRRRAGLFVRRAVLMTGPNDDQKPGEREVGQRKILRYSLLQGSYLVSPALGGNRNITWEMSITTR